MENRQHRRLRISALLEGISLLFLLLVAVPLKHLGSFPVATAIMGPLHGLLLIAYLWMAFYSAGMFGWSVRRALAIALPALVPFGTIVVWHMLKGSVRQ